MTTDRPTTSDDVVDLIRQLDGRIRVLEQIKDPILRDEVVVVLRLIDSLHRTMLGKLATRLKATAAWDTMIAEPDIAMLFGLYDLAPLDDDGEVDPEEEVAPTRRLPVVNGPELVEVARLADLADGTPRVVTTSDAEVLLVRLDDAVYACDPACPSCGGSLADGVVSNAVVVCPDRNCAFDVRRGRRADGPVGPGLRVFPVTVRQGRVLLAVGVAPQIAWR